MSTTTLTVELPFTWNAGLIVISYIQAVQAAYSAIHILQLQLSRSLVVLSALCFAGSGIWSMHFVGMAALDLHYNVTYNVPWTVASVIFSFVTCAAGFLLVYEKIDIPRAATDGSLSGHVKILKATPHHFVVIAGVFIALGVCVMHYTGMMAMRSDAHHHLHWDAIAGSCVIALLAATAALYLAFVFPVSRQFTLPTSIVAGGAVCGMHYTGMYGYSFTAYLDPDLIHANGGYNQAKEMVPYVLVASWAISFVSMSLASFQYKRKSDECQAQATAGVKFAKTIGRLISRYDMDGARRYYEQFDEPADPQLIDQLSEMLENLEPYRAFLPQALFAKDADSSSGGGDDNMERNRENWSDLESEGDEDESNLSSIIEEDLAQSQSTNRLSSQNSGSLQSSAIPSDTQPSSPALLGTTAGMSGSRSAFLGRGGKVRSNDAMGISVKKAFSTSFANLRKSIKGADLQSKSIALLAINLNGFHEFLAQKGQFTAFDVHTRFLESVSQIAAANKGIVDSFHGDHILVTWNAASNTASFQRRSAICAVAIAEAVKLIYPPGPSMGLTCGQALVGTLGSKSLRHFSTIGPIYNEAHVLERMCKRYGGEVSVLANSRVCEQLGSDILFQHVDFLQLPSAPGGTIVTSVEAMVSADADEWMYQLEKCEERNPYFKVNAMIEELAKRESADFNPEEECMEAFNGLTGAQQARVRNLVARKTTTGTFAPDLGSYYSMAGHIRAFDVSGSFQRSEVA